MGQQVAPFIPEITRALSEQSARMDRALIEEKQRRAASAMHKRPAPTPTTADLPDLKRPKLDGLAASNTAATAGLSSADTASALVNFDFTTLAAPLITELIVANLQAFEEGELQKLVSAYLAAQSGPSSTSSPAAVPVPPSLGTSSRSQTGTPQPSTTGKSVPHATTTPLPTEPAANRAATGTRKADESSSGGGVVKEEPVDPLKMDIDDEVEEESPSASMVRKQYLERSRLASLLMPDGIIGCYARG
jgi:symplekin